MSLSLDDTIAAIASPPGGGARAIVRLSGPHALGVVEPFVSSASLPLGQLRRATQVTGQWHLPQWSLAIDVQLLVWPHTRSYTGQPSVEVLVLGSPPLVQAVLDTLLNAGCRAAAPGEFTLRAVLNGRLDLTQAEAVLGVIHARSDRELHVALEQLAGGFGAPLRNLRGELLDALAHLEAGLDFVEEDIEFVTRDELRRQLLSGQSIVTELLDQLHQRAWLVDLPRVVLVGEPNVGKSSLFNALCGRPQALVSPEAGTTRDYLSARLDLAGFECELIDTAGLDAGVADDTIDASAQRLAQWQHEHATLRVQCLDGTQAIEHRWQSSSVGPLSGVLDDTPQLVVLTKCDRAVRTIIDDTTIATSAKTGLGIAEVKRAIRRQLEALTSSDAPVVASTAARCRSSLVTAQTHLAAAAELVERAGGEELIAVEMRAALDALGTVVGAIYTDDILDRIFSRFCIGK